MADPDASPPVVAAPQTATMIDGLGDFMHGYAITDDDRHVIVFTDKEQDDAPVTAVAAIAGSSHTNLVVDDSAHTVTDLGTKSGDTYTGVTFYELATVADDTDPDLAFMGTLTCPDGTACNITTNADGEVTAITGYRFTGSRAARAEVTVMDAAAQAAANNDYLVFGVWMREDANDDGTADDRDFGAFATGGSTAPAAVEITGTASYTGSATGIYTNGSSVDDFMGRAALTAKFGAPGTATDAEAADDEVGVITGMIDQIMVGGSMMSDVISLHSGHDRTSATAGNITNAGGTFTGTTSMGAAMVDGNNVTYTYNGTWSGQFFNGTADDTTTTDVNESHVAPGSVAGTFGVTGTMGEGDDAVTRSYLGAFGAHIDD